MLAFSDGPVTLEDIMSLRGRTIAPPVNAPPTTDETEEGVLYLGMTNHPSIHHFCTGTHTLFYVCNINTVNQVIYAVILFMRIM